MPKPKTDVVKDFPEPEEKSEFIEIPFRDGVVTIPRERAKWPTRAILALQKGGNSNVLQAIEIVLGPQQWDFVIDSEIAEFDKFCVAFTEDVFEKVFV